VLDALDYTETAGKVSAQSSAQNQPSFAYILSLCLDPRELDDVFGDRQVQHIDVRNPHALENKSLEKSVRDDVYHVEHREAA
jgi:hypothetical protein